MDCANMKPLPSWKFSVLMEIPGGRRGRRRTGSGYVCKWLAPRGVGWEKVIDILVEKRKKKEWRKIPALATVESTAILFL